MTAPLTTGSGIERWMMCLASGVLPRAFDANGSEDASRGTEIHAFLQRVTQGMTEDESLEQVDERFHDACREIDTSGIRDVLGLTAELALAYNPIADTARPLGVALDRQYEAAGVTEDDIPLSIDVAGIDNPAAPMVGVVVDYKSGWSKRTAAASNWQMKGGSLALARAYDLVEVRAQLIHLRGGAAAWRDRATFGAADFAIASSQLRERREVVLRARDRFAKLGEQPEATKGPWCRYCPSYHACPAQMNEIRALANPDEFDGIERVSPVPPEVIAEAYRKVREAKQQLKRIESLIYAAAHERAVLIETEADGTELWLGMTETIGRLEIDADKARKLMAERLTDPTDAALALNEISEYSVTKGRIETALKKRVAKGEGAKALRDFMAELTKRGGARKPMKYETDIYKRKPALPAGGGK